VLWRVHSDAVNKELFLRWLADSSVETVLKTDLFDEALSDGLYSTLASQARQVYGMDLSARILRIAGSRQRDLQSMVADVRCLPFSDSTFDVVVSNSTLDHFGTHEEIVTSLKELHRVLRPSGRLLLTLDNPANPVVALRQMLPFHVLNRLGVLPYYIGTTLGPHHLRRILHRLRFEVREMGAVLHCPRMPAVVLCRLLAKYGTLGMQRRFLHLLMAFEGLSRWPTRFFTGHFVVVNALRR
jgi:SAM-dependent methyltransferase